jgi:hypothetical protein
MKSRSKKYKFAIEWIAINDEPTVVQIADLISVTLIADMFGFDPQDVAKDVLNLRQKLEDKRSK